jgi:hypothetical protein
MALATIALFADIDQNRVAGFCLFPGVSRRDFRDVPFRLRDQFLKAIRLFPSRASGCGLEGSTRVRSPDQNSPRAQQFFVSDLLPVSGRLLPPHFERGFTNENTADALLIHSPRASVFQSDLGVG